MTLKFIRYCSLRTHWLRLLPLKQLQNKEIVMSGNLSILRHITDQL